MTYAPVFNPDMYSFSVAENAAIGTTVGQVQATDLDNQTLSYWLGEDSFGSPFGVDASTGEIILRRELNYEWQSSESLTIEATDTDWDSAFASVEITITDFNEHPVFGQSLYSFSLAENAATGTMVGTVSATDPQNDPLTYSIGAADEGSGLTGAAFEIDSLTGEISFQGTLDYESASSIGLKVYAFDEGVNIAEADVQIAFLDAAYDPVFDLASYAFSIDENEPADTSLETVHATDPLDLGITYSLEDGYDNHAFSIDPATGHITAKASLNYEYGSAYNLTAFATNANGVTTAVAVTVTVNNIDETPDPNNAPTLSNVTFTMTQQKDGYAIGEIDGTITDGYVAEGHYNVKIDIYDDGTIDLDYSLPQDMTSLWFELGINYGTHDIAVRVDEYELETGSTLAGSWVVISAVAAAPANSAPTVSNLSYSTIDEGYGPDNQHHYLTGDIIDGTRGYSTYTLQFDMDDDGTVDDYVAVENDWETFALEFFSSPGTRNVAVRVVEHDLNTGTDLTGAWESFGFTVLPYVPNNEVPVMKFVNFIESGYGYGGYLQGEFNDDFAAPDYKLEIDVDGDGSVDYWFDIGTSESFNENLMLQPGETIEATRVRIFDNGLGVASDWMAVGDVNNPPVIAPPRDDIKISLSALEAGAITNGHLVETISATDQDDPNGDELAFFITDQPLEFTKTTANGKKVNEWLPEVALDIGWRDGKITITNRDALAKFLREYGKFEFEVSVGDHLANINAEFVSVTVTIYDDWNIYFEKAQSYVSNWKTEALDYVNSVYLQGIQAVDKLRSFINGHYDAFNTGVDAGVQGITWASATLSATKKAPSWVSIGSTAAQILSKAYSSVKSTGSIAWANQAKKIMEEIWLEDKAKIMRTAHCLIDTEEGELFALLAATSNDPLDKKALKWRARFEEVKRTLRRTYTDGEKLVAPPVDNIYGEMLIAFAKWKTGGSWPDFTFSMQGGDHFQRTEGEWWYSYSPPRFFVWDSEDVVDELNEIGYIPPDTRAIKVQSGIVTRYKRD